MNKTSTLIIAKEGWVSIAICYTLFLLFISLESSFFALIFLALGFFALYFYRNPERIPEERDKKAILSPVDGKVVSITNQEESTVITIQKGLTDCALLRAPVEGRIEDIKLLKGLTSTNNNIAKEINERATFNIGALSIKVVSKLFENDGILYKKEPGELYAGERIGFLRFGIVELNIPHTKLKIGLGDSVKAGVTILGYTK